MNEYELKQVIIPITTEQLIKNFKFNLQLFAREEEAVKYRGRRRWNGSWGKLWWDNELLFEVQKFEAKVTADREDVYISISKDSKIVSLTGELSFTIKSVVNRNINK